MALGVPSNCINHPAVLATDRCKQCGKPVCAACVVTGPTGKFCGEACKQNHQAFIQRAQQLESARPSGRLLVSVRRLAVKLLLWGALILAIAYVLTKFQIYQVPILSDLLRRYAGA